MSFEVLLFDGRILQPVRLIRRMLQLRRVQGTLRADLPLFMVGGRALDETRLNEYVRQMVRAAGGATDGVSSHGLRRGGATAALAAGVDPETIRMLGRWDSKVYQIYSQRTRRAAMRLGSIVASTSF